MTSIEFLLNHVVTNFGKTQDSARQFTKWLLAASGAVAALFISNGVQLIELVGRTGFSTILSLIASSVVCGFVAILATNMMEGTLVAHQSLLDLKKSREWIDQVASDPIDEPVFQHTYLSLFFGPLRTAAERAMERTNKSLVNTPAGIFDARPYFRFGRAASTYVLFSQLQVFFVAVALFSAVYFIWAGQGNTSPQIQSSISKSAGVK